jgi:uncharacterized membrane protein YebE (DUF533 family)
MNTIDTIKILGSLLGSGSLSKGSGGNVLGNILGSALGGASSQQTQGGGALGDILGSLIGGGTAKNTSGGSIGDLLGGLLKGGNQQQQTQGGGLGDLLGSMLNGQSNQQSQTSGGGMGDLLGSLLGGGASNASNNQSSSLGGAGGLGGLLTSAITKYAQSQHADHPTLSHDNADHLPRGLDATSASTQADLLIKAMINSAKSDGSIDRVEQDNIIKRLGDISSAEADYVRSEFNAPLNVSSFARSVPRGMEQQVYAVSLSSIDLDNNKEARYLGELAQALNITPQTANAIHKQLGAPTIFA